MGAGGRENPFLAAERGSRSAFEVELAAVMVGIALMFKPSFGGQARCTHLGMIVVRHGASILWTDQPQEIDMEERVIVDSSFFAVVNAPLEKIDTPVWCFSLQDKGVRRLPLQRALPRRVMAGAYQFGISV